MSKKSNWILLIFLMISIFFNGITWYKYRMIEKDYEKRVTILDDRVRQSESIIDSLEINVSLRESIIDSLSVLRQEVVIEKIIKVDMVRELPLPESVEFLIKKLEEYEEEYQDLWLFPSDVSL